MSSSGSIWGTKILAGIFTPQLRLLQTVKLSTKASRGFESVVERVARCVRDAVDEADLSLKQVRGVGIGAPGAINPESGEVILRRTFSGRTRRCKSPRKHLGVPVFVENDCNACTLGIHEVELKGKSRSLLGIFLGTGIGGGLILDGQLYSGFNRTAGEVGHMVIQVGGPKCSCGNSGCFEALASRTSIFRELARRVKEGEKTLLTESLKEGESIIDLKSGDLRKALRKGDKLAAKVLQEAAKHTGIAVANLVNILSPQTVVLGGGVMDALEDDLMPIILETARNYAMPGTLKDVEILASKLGDAAGITGAAVLVRQRLKLTD